jgi:SAM-dependent methyltransferase
MDSGAFWDEEVIQQRHVSWLADPNVRAYVNALIGGERTPMWPLDWFERVVGHARFSRALSIGCGSGALERDLIRRDICETIDAFDASVNSLRLAVATAATEGIHERIRYFAMDFNMPVLPRNVYDVVFFHQAAHHVAKLEKLYRAVLLGLRRGGIVYLDEYVGPSRSDWTHELLAGHNAVYASLPEEVRTAPSLDLPIEPHDESEAVRSSEIEHQLTVGFRTIARRDYGGTILAVLFPWLRPEAVNESIVESLIRADRDAIERGVPSYYALIVAYAKTGIAKQFASINYYFVPKAKRVMRELRALLWRKAEGGRRKPKASPND